MNPIAQANAYLRTADDSHLGWKTTSLLREGRRWFGRMATFRQEERAVYSMATRSWHTVTRWVAIR